MKYGRPLCLGLLALSCALPAAAQFQKPEHAVKYRKAAFTMIASHFNRIGAVVKGQAPFDAKAVADNAQIVATLSGMPWHAFGAGTNVGQTEALPAVWSEADKFKNGSTQFQDAAGKLNTAAKSGNLDAIKAAFGETGKTCKACHDNFKKD
jgi:cytochrome c556